MKRFIGVLAMMLSAASAAQAQVEWRWANVISNGTSIGANLQFRNTNKYGDASIIAITGFGVYASQRVVDRCAPPILDCYIAGDVPIPSGSVQNTEFYAGQTQWRNGINMYPLTNSSPYQLNIPWVTGSGSVPYAFVLGCQVPEAHVSDPLERVRDFGFRTCEADGFDGWITANVYMGIADPDPPAGWYGIDDLSVYFTTSVLEGPDAMQVVPEPATYALLAVGLSAIAVVRTRRRKI